MLLVAPQAQAATRQVGIDIPVQWYADASGQMTIDRFAALPADQLATTRQIPSFGYSRKTWWLRSELPGTWFAGEPRWLQLGPSFVDHLTIYYRPLGSDAPWAQRTFGDRDGARESDLHCRESVLILPPPPTAAGYEVVFRLQSTSTLILLASLSSPQEFVQRATADTAFWSFYFGLAAVASGVALWLALALRRRLLWGICLFSLNYPLVAALHGFPEWFFGHAALPFQDFMISSLSLFSYATALWLHSEIFDLKKNMPRLHQLLIAAVILNLVLQVSIPLGFYGFAMQIEGVVFIIITPVLLFTSWWLWRKKAIDRTTLLLGLLPPFYVVAAVLVQLSIHGIIPFHMAIFSLWQYALIVHIITVLIIAILRVRAENRQLEQKQRLARELQIEREASFHQRQFMGMVAHEFRTPLAVIQAALENLRLSAASTSLERQQTALLTVINMAASVVAISHDHYLNIRQHGAVESPQLQADAGLLCIAIANLLDNAVKYSPPGEIAIDIHSDAGQTELRIRDHGPGLPAGQAELIFERYRRGEHTSPVPGGTGLGLYVARQIVQAHDGKLWLAEHGPDGCTFILTLPTVA
ncbi:sensor histidine kinase [Klebsiella pneumoniae]|uniref:sensor histidine kinase n=1 Tax=Klebsiella pneumoniae TaxID=573 RepID=UPI00164B819C|nr:sensor histidine kinase [Klebsiella pneumoniae]MBC4931876.1 sensor histidine kinase [Klebsiella pneumoniae]MCQ8736457.1 sensor histidine kinase [Klebsiella pneumoniae]MDG0309832.1 sensor histidine kinase [Klebsiella pneumoniae]HBR1646879.1 sensor histidine kinase [Klebsiella pneumoniae]HBS3753097.1 sensor histidine kinase [Klebsiella pneumoniae]